MNDFKLNKKNGIGAEFSSRKLSCDLLWKYNSINSIDGLSSVFLSFDYKYVTAASRNGEMILIDAANGNVINSQKLNFPLIRTFIDSSTCDIFAFGTHGIARLEAKGSILWRKDIRTPIINGAVSQINKKFIICYEGNKIVIADYNATPEYKSAIDSKGPISSIYVPELSGNFVITTTAGDVFYMNAQGRIIWQFCINDRLNSVSASRDGKIIFAGSSDNKVLCLHSDQKMLFNFELKSPIICTDISEDGKYFAVGCLDGYIYVLDASGSTVFYDRPFSKVSCIYLTEKSENFLTLSDSNLISMYKICERKTPEEKSKDFSGFIEIDHNYKFTNENRCDNETVNKNKTGVSVNYGDNDFEKFIEL